ncbi:MAG TPA: winged helix DNA-binding domain-containing protein [Verrucomicrobiae bacterium]|nr:winged helix DNA-binding domain-containing protein [Verrucomicrobiae bacterium]
MNMTDIAAHRLHNQYLIEGLGNPQDVVRKMGAMQAQDFMGAKWAIGLRSKNATDESVTGLFNDGKILRTHMLRPTWHFVAPEDIRWMQSLTAPRVHALNKYYYKKLGLDEGTLRKGIDVLKQVLKGGKQLTRAEAAAAFSDAGIDASGLRLAYLVMYAELEAVVCSGALRGKQHTIALISERAPQAKILPKEQALKEFALRFFTAHGPATVQDLAWWSSLSAADVKSGVELADLQRIEIDAKTYYCAKQADTTIRSPLVHLLPNYDEYLIAYKERSAAGQAVLEKRPVPADFFYHFVVLDGQLVGGWKRIVGKSMTVELNLFTHFGPKQAKALDAAGQQLQDFLQIPVKLTNL